VKVFPGAETREASGVGSTRGGDKADGVSMQALRVTCHFVPGDGAKEVPLGVARKDFGVVSKINWLLAEVVIGMLWCVLSTQW
jgi:hypothetical protein